MPLAGREVPGIELAYHAHKAGIPMEELRLCLAIAWGESNWREAASNFVGGDTSYGLWQINMQGRLLQDRLRKFEILRPEDLYTASVNARAMVHTYRESISWGYSGWRPWGAFTDGGYLRGWDRAGTAVALYKQRLADSGDRLHLGEPHDCDSI